MIRRVLYGPPNWLVTKFTAEDRRMFGFWVIILGVVGTIFFGTKTLWVSVLSVVALIPNYTTETPMTMEGD